MNLPNRAMLVLVVMAVAVGAAFVFMLLVNYVSRMGNDTLVMVLVGALFACVFMVRPIALLWFTALLTLVVVGIVKYLYPSLSQISWLAYGSSFLLFGSALMYARSSGQQSVLLTLSVCLFLLVAASSTALALPDPKQVLVASKSLFMFGGIWAVLAWAPLKEEAVWTWLKGLAVIGAVQWMPALYQYFFVRATRLDEGLGRVSASDSVVGTFGGSTEGGGMTGALALYMIVVIFVLLALYRDGLLKRGQLAWLGLFLGVPLLLTEVKAIFFYIPVSLLVLFGGDLVRKPLLAIGWGLVAVVFFVGLLFAYQALHWSAKSSDLQQNIREKFLYSFQKEGGYRARQSGVLTRLGVIEFWWQEHNEESRVEMLVGHGLGASRTTGQLEGSVAARYEAKIDSTGLAAMLWDFGVFGVVAILGIFGAAFWRAGRLAKEELLGERQRALARGLQAVIPLLLMSMVYRDDIPYAAPVMFMAMCILGLVSWLNRQVSYDATD